MKTPPIGTSEALGTNDAGTPFTVPGEAPSDAPIIKPKSRGWWPVRFRLFGYFRKKITWWWKTAASLMVGLSAALTIGVATYIVALSLTQNTITIEPLSTPKVMADNGYTPEVAAAHFRAALDRAILAAQLRGPQLALRSEQPDIVVPSVGISAQTIANSIRKFLPISQARIISGNLPSRMTNFGFVCGPATVTSTPAREVSVQSAFGS
jgi:hypothetical protein